MSATPINLQTPGIHHVAIRVTDLARARQFYIDRLGFTYLMGNDAIFLFAAGSTAFGVRGPDAATAVDDSFSPFRIGLDHIALTCADEAELHRVAEALAAWGIENTGVKRDPVLDKLYVAFKDPDGIKWEFYMA